MSENKTAPTAIRIGEESWRIIVDVNKRLDQQSLEIIKVNKIKGCDVTSAINIAFLEKSECPEGNVNSLNYIYLT